MNFPSTIVTVFGISVGSWIAGAGHPQIFAIAFISFGAICAYELNNNFWGRND